MPPGHFDHLIGGVRPSRHAAAHPPLALATAPKWSGASRSAYPILSRPQRQSHAGSCGAQAAARALEADALSRTGAVFQVCRMDVYYGARWLRGEEAQDSGVVMEDLWRWLREYGTVSEVLRPYDPALVTTWRPPETWAAERRMLTADVLPMPVVVDSILAELERGRCVPFASHVYRQMEAEAATTGVEIGPDGGGSLGGHARVFCGFDLDRDVSPYGRGALLLANSWQAWGLPHPLAATDVRFAGQVESFSWLPVSRVGEWIYHAGRIARGLAVEA